MHCAQLPVLALVRASSVRGRRARAV